GLRLRGDPSADSTSRVRGSRCVGETAAMVRVLSCRPEDAPAGVLEEARALMDVAVDGDFGDDDWDHGLGGWHVVALDGEQVVSHASVVVRMREVEARPFRTGYVEAVATHPDRHGQGIGSLVMEE